MEAVCLADGLAVAKRRHPSIGIRNPATQNKNIDLNQTLGRNILISNLVLYKTRIRYERTVNLSHFAKFYLPDMGGVTKVMEAQM